MTSGFLFREINNKKLFNFIVYLSLFNTEETKTLIIASYYMKRRITKLLGLG